MVNFVKIDKMDKFEKFGKIFFTASNEKWKNLIKKNVKNNKFC